MRRTQASGSVEPEGIHYHDKFEVKYGSLMVGAYRLSDNFSLYALAGVGTVKATFKERIPLRMAILFLTRISSGSRLHGARVYR